MCKPSIMKKFILLSLIILQGIFAAPVFPQESVYFAQSGIPLKKNLFTCASLYNSLHSSDELLLKKEIASGGYHMNNEASFSFQENRINKPLLRKLAIGTGVLYAGSIYGLYHLWYKDYPQSSFHFFNDNGEWLQIDKIGHATSSYYISMLGYEALSITGVEDQTSAISGGALALLYLTTVETFDGFSKGWGASWGDVIANATGASLFVSQQLIWHEQRIRMKWSYLPTKYAQYRPDLLGENGIQRALKDYNGHTYWLSGNISSFILQDNKFPKWLNFAVGYSGTGMTGAFSNPDFHDGIDLPEFDRYRRYLISADIDLTKLGSRNKTLNMLFKAVSFIKLPMPAIEFSKNGMKLKPLYF